MGEVKKQRGWSGTSACVWPYAGDVAISVCDAALPRVVNKDHVDGAICLLPGDSDEEVSPNFFMGKATH